MDKKDTGGQAFPGSVAFNNLSGSEILGNEGMTLRDYFAGQVLHQVYRDVYKTSYDEMAKISYKIADAMIKEKNRRMKPCI